MTQRSCCVPGCLVKLGDGVQLHRFPNPSNPSQIERFRTWVMKIGGDIVKEDNGFIYRNRKVCHKHFQDQYIFPSMKLSALAIPTLQIPGVHVGPHRILVPSVEVTVRADDVAQSIPMDTDQQIHDVEHRETQSVEVAVEAPSTIAVFPSTSATAACSSTSATAACSSTTAVPSSSINKGRTKLQQPLTAVERHLKSVICETKLKLRKSQNVRRKLKVQMEMAEKFLSSSGYNLLKEKMSPAAQTFFTMQINQYAKKPTGRRFTLDEKILCLSLYKPSPRAYRLLGQMCVLPKRKTLDKLLNNIDLCPGINEMLFEHLKKRVENLPMRHRYCTVIFDEMAISPNLYYDKAKDIIHGFIDNGEERAKIFSDHVCVFMIRGITKKFKQPVVFSFCKGSTKSTDLFKMIKNIIKRIMDCGLHVVATVCDQGASNMAALNMLMNETKAEYLRNGNNYSGGFFEQNSKRIYAIFDPPHLMKGIRNNLLSKNLEYQEDGKTKVASWSHIEALYKRGPGYRGVKLVNKLTAQHVIPSLIPKMRVKHCTQVFSENVGRTMGYMAEIGQLPRSSADTADLLLFFDHLFDSVNGNYHKPAAGKIYRSAVTPRSPHLRLWYKSLPVLKSMKFVTKCGQRGTVPSITSWVKTIEAFIAVTKDLHSAGLKSILLRHINQDPLENFFGAIRAHGLRNIMPSANAFIGSYKSLLISNIASYKSVGANCEADDLNLLQSLKCFLTQKMPQRANTSEINLNNAHLCIDEVDVDALIKNRANKEKCAAVAYCSGWLILKLRKNIYVDCEICRKDLETNDIQEFHEYIRIREYNNSESWLCYPTRDAFAFFFNVEHIVTEILKTDCHKERILEYIETIVLMNINLSFLTCPEHKEQLAKMKVRKSILFFINNWCKDVNQVLTGKTTFWDCDDGVKVAAHDYFIRHKRK